MVTPKWCAFKQSYSSQNSRLDDGWCLFPNGEVRFRAEGRDISAGPVSDMFPRKWHEKELMMLYPHTPCCQSIKERILFFNNKPQQQGQCRRLLMWPSFTLPRCPPESPRPVAKFFLLAPHTAQPWTVSAVTTQSLFLHGLLLKYEDIKKWSLGPLKEQPVHWPQEWGCRWDTRKTWHKLRERMVWWQPRATSHSDTCRIRETKGHMGTVVPLCFTRKETEWLHGYLGISPSI